MGWLSWGEQGGSERSPEHRCGFFCAGGERAWSSEGHSGHVPHSLACLCSLPRACVRSEQRLEVQEQLLALRHWLDAVEKRLLALPEPGTALQVTSGPGVWLGRAEPGRTSPRLHRGC